MFEDTVLVGAGGYVGWLIGLVEGDLILLISMDPSSMTSLVELIKNT